MKIDKVGKQWRVRKTVNKKLYTITFNHKPSQAEVIQRLSEVIGETDHGGTLDFETAAFNYIESKSAILSPSTYREYRSMVGRYSDGFRRKNIYDITYEIVQREVNEIAKVKSPKTTRNYSALICSVINFYRRGVKFSVSLPQSVKNEPYVPSDEDVKRILEEAKGSQFEIPIRLACYGLRRSEICALSVDDLDGNILTINKALVLNSDREWIVKTTKTVESTRQIYIDDYLADLIRQQGKIYNDYPENITHWLSRCENRLGIEHFTLHKLRHYYASMAHALGIPDAYIMKAGGWKTDNVMKRVYRHAQEEKSLEAMKDVAAHLSDLG